MGARSVGPDAPPEKAALDAAKWPPQGRLGLRFCGLRGDYVFDNGNLFGTGGELLIEGASIRDLRFQNAQILHGLRTGAQTDFEGRDVLPSMRALRLLDKAGDR
jgi:hypothetical protein